MIIFGPQMETCQLITILGPTALGKTTFAAALAGKSDSEVISADSRQVYRSMNIGTGKDLDDYVVNGKAAPYHLIDICEPGYRYNVFEYQRDFFRMYRKMPHPLDRRFPAHRPEDSNNRIFAGKNK